MWHRVIPALINQLDVGLAIPSLYFQMGDKKIESRVGGVDKIFSGIPTRQQISLDIHKQIRISRGANKQKKIALIGEGGGLNMRSL